MLSSSFSTRRFSLAAAILVVALGEMALLMVWQGNGYWNFSDGVYAESARAFLHGLEPYRDLAAAQPPPVFLLGALLLAISDTPVALHVGLGLVDLVTAGLVGLAVWRLTGREPLALVAAVLAPLLPITLNSHAQLLPETLAAPLILGGALACADDRWAGAVLLAAAAWCKFAFIIPALATAIAAPRPRRTIGLLLAAFVALMAASLLAFGVSLWRETVVAQLQVGEAAAHYVAGLLAQIAWSELPLLIGAAAFAVALWREERAFEDPALARTLGAATVGGLALAVSVFKRGSYLNVIAVADPPLLAMALAGAAYAWNRHRRARPVTALAGLLLAAQSISLLAHPSDPWLAVRPFAASGLAWSAGPGQVAHEVAAARRCPRMTPYAGSPYVAFVAGRRMPGNQPDLFMLRNASEDARFAREAARDRPACA